MVSNRLEGNEILKETSIFLQIQEIMNHQGQEGLTIIWQIILMKKELMARVALKKR